MRVNQNEKPFLSLWCLAIQLGKVFFGECKLGKEKAKREEVNLRQETLFAYTLPLRLDLMYSIQFSGARLNFDW